MRHRRVPSNKRDAQFFELALDQVRVNSNSILKYINEGQYGQPNFETLAPAERILSALNAAGVELGKIDKKFAIARGSHGAVYRIKCASQGKVVPVALKAPLKQKDQAKTNKAVEEVTTRWICRR